MRSSRILVIGGGMGLALALGVALAGHGVTVAENRLPIALRTQEWTIEDPRQPEDLYPGLDDPDQVVASGRNKESHDPAQDHGSCLLG
jgi:predicted dinucleotide-binding enzyme